ncbi:MAG: 30S ribosomal protein S16 [SAR202 cluster bacterium MP-SAtl-SRR3965592-G2]|nr:MAG: 30S ribosomal protein S16 [SAR202 cluster bacterium MP-SAtl-SRR3965592-G2]
MLRIRLRRVGKKGNPSYRIVVADSRAPRDGAYVEWIGNYDPMADPPAVTIKEDRAQAWLSQGAQPSDAVARILDWKGILTRTPKQRTTATAVEEEPEVAAPAPVAEAPTPEPEADDTTAVAEEAAEEPVAEVVAEETAEEPVAEVAAEESAEEISGEAESADDIDSEDTGEETSKDTPEEESSE